MNQYALFDEAMSRAISDRRRKILLAEIFLIMAEIIGRKPDSEMEPRAESSGHGGAESTRFLRFFRAKPDSEMKPRTESSGARRGRKHKVFTFSRAKPDSGIEPKAESSDILSSK